ncbi:MAG: hypothetical protein OXF00_05465, partial [bacterium]|nr:hypothetical protein [bacterium]
HSAFVAVLRPIAPNPKRPPIRAFYSASNGGHTERSGYVFAADLPYLSAKPDPFDRHGSNPYASWTRSYDVADFNRWLNDHSDTAVGQLISLEIEGGTGTSGRLDKARIRISGTSRSVTVTGSRLQARVNTAARESGNDPLLSTLFEFAVPGPTRAQTPGEKVGPADSDAAPDDEALYSGVITGSDFCLNRSLGGPTTYAFDRDGDGVADVCALRGTRRAAVARQRTLEHLALVEQEVFTARFAEECRSVAESFGEPDRESEDECQQHRSFSANTLGGSGGGASGDSSDDGSSNGGVGAAPHSGEDRDFYSGVITGPDFCLNHSLGGPTTYAFDGDGDGVADVCALPRTRRSAVARQRALEHLPEASEELAALYDAFFVVNCHMGPETLGEPEKEAQDPCEPHIQAGAV